VSTWVTTPKEDALREIFGRGHVVIGTIHLRPLPGSPAYRGESPEAIAEAALRDAAAYVGGGVHGLIVENSGDLPFAKPEDIGPETVSYMTWLTSAVVRESGVPVGVNCLANAVIPGIAIAAASQGRFVRSNQWVNAYIANEGFVEGASARATRFRTGIGAHHVRVLADVHVKHGSHAIVGDRPVEEQARDAEFFDADVLIATGMRTGDSTSVDEVLALRAGSALPVIVGSGLDLENVEALFAHADGAIVGSSLKHDGAWWKPVDRERVHRLMDVVERIRSRA
jgi:uncharacterized protein